MWFPELFNRFDEFTRDNPGQDASVCEVTRYVVNSGSQQNGKVCTDKIESAVFMESLITVASAIPSNIVAVLGMDRLGRKFFLGELKQYGLNGIDTATYVAWMAFRVIGTTSDLGASISHPGCNSKPKTAAVDLICSIDLFQSSVL